MNERIRELLYEAGGQYGGENHLTGKTRVYTDDVDYEKFAELIVRECAELTSRYQMGTTRLPDIIVSYNYSDKLEDVLKKHFGVEE